MPGAIENIHIVTLDIITHTNVAYTYTGTSSTQAIEVESIITPSDLSSALDKLSLLLSSSPTAACSNSPLTWLQNLDEEKANMKTAQR